jgi:RNA polymerase sigma-70 factor, ECF subfamily
MVNMKEASTAEMTAKHVRKVTDDFHGFYQQYAGIVYRTALRVTGNPADAEDVLQNVFVRFLNCKVILDPRQAPKSYMQRAAVNASIDLLRKRPVSPSVDPEEVRDNSNPESSPFLKELLRKAFAKLPSQDAEIFVLCYLEGYTYEELADQFGIERGTIASRLHRIKIILKNELNI